MAGTRPAMTGGAPAMTGGGNVIPVSRELFFRIGEVKHGGQDRLPAANA